MVDTNQSKHFLGYEYIHWLGVVENRMDPLKVGRCQVRIYAWHSQNKQLLPTSDLIWAHHFIPANALDATPPKEGTMVAGYFLDGEAAQYPVLTHSVPGIPDTKPNYNQGFTDPRTSSQLQSAPSSPKSVVYNNDGTGVNVTNNSSAPQQPAVLNEPTTSRIARNENVDSTVIGQINNNLVTNIAIANSTDTFSEPKLSYNAQYPYDRVMQTESGHVMELDDTPGSERISLIHRVGSYMEFKPDGSQATKILGNRFTIIMEGDNVYIMGDCNLSVQGNKNLHVKGDVNVQVTGNWIHKVQGDMEFDVQGDVTWNVSGNYTYNIDSGNYLIQSPTVTIKTGIFTLDAGEFDGKISNGNGLYSGSGVVNWNATGPVTLNAPSITLNQD